MRFSGWLVGTGSIPSPAWAQALLSLILSDVFTLAQGRFITYMCWSVLCWILSGGPLQIWLTLCVTLPSLVLCPTDASCLIFLDPQFRVHQTLPGFLVPVLQPGCSPGSKLDYCSAHFISYLSGISVLCCLMISVSWSRSYILFISGLF